MKTQVQWGEIAFNLRKRADELLDRMEVLAYPLDSCEYVERLETAIDEFDKAYRDALEECQ